MVSISTVFWRHNFDYVKQFCKHLFSVKSLPVKGCMTG